MHNRRVIPGILAWHRTLLLVATLLFTLAVLPGPGAPAPTAFAASGWSTPFDVSDDQFGWFPDIAVDARGAVHVIWGSGVQDASVGPDAPEASRDLLRYRVLRDGQWSPMNDIAFTCVGGYTVRNSIAAASDGQVHVLFRSCTDVSVIHATAQEAWSAGAWSAAQRLGGSYYNAIAADSTGTLHAFYNEGLVGSAEGVTLLSEIFYRRSTDGGETWSIRTNLAQLPGGDERIQAKVDGRDRVHLVWDHGSDWYLGLDHPGYGVYRRSDDGGLTWHDQVLLGVGDVPVVQTTLGLAASENPLVVYRSAFGSELYYQTSSDGGDTWSAAQPIPGVLARDPLERNLDSYSMATDSAGRVHLLIAGFPAGSIAAIPMLLHLTWDGQSWSPPDVVAATPNRPMWPRAAVAGGNQLHVTWFSYTDASGWGDRRIWHSSRLVDAPAIAPAVPAAPAPAIAPAELTPAVPDTMPAASAPGPVATASFRGAPPPEALASTPLLTPGLALVPAVGLVATIAALMLWRRSRSR